MKQALIDPDTSVRHIVSWTITPPIKPVYATYPNSARVADVVTTSFDVAPPLFWVTCADDVMADQWYYDMSNGSINPVVNASTATQDSQPTVDGAQTL